MSLAEEIKDETQQKWLLNNVDHTPTHAWYTALHRKTSPTLLEHDFLKSILNRDNPNRSFDIEKKNQILGSKSERRKKKKQRGGDENADKKMNDGNSSKDAISIISSLHGNEKQKRIKEEEKQTQMSRKDRKQSSERIRQRNWREEKIEREGEQRREVKRDLIKREIIERDRGKGRWMEKEENAHFLERKDSKIIVINEKQNEIKKLKKKKKDSFNALTACRRSFTTG